MDEDLITESEKKEFISFVIVTIRTWCRYEIDESGGLLWWSAVKKKCTLEEFRVAMINYFAVPQGSIKTPMPADILALIPRYREAIDNSWKQVLFAVKHYGRNYSPEFLSSPAISYTVDQMGGWPSFCEMIETNGPDSVKKTFLSKFTLNNATNVKSTPLLSAMGPSGRVISIQVTQGNKLRVEQKSAQLLGVVSHE